MTPPKVILYRIEHVDIVSVSTAKINTVEKQKQEKTKYFSKKFFVDGFQGRKGIFYIDYYIIVGRGRL